MELFPPPPIPIADWGAAKHRGVEGPKIFDLPSPLVTCIHFPSSDVRVTGFIHVYPRASSPLHSLENPLLHGTTQYLKSHSQFNPSIPLHWTLPFSLPLLLPPHHTRHRLLPNITLAIGSRENPLPKRNQKIHPQTPPRLPGRFSGFATLLTMD